MTGGFRDRFPMTDDLLRASPEDIGAELVLHIQQRQPPRIHEANLVGDLVHLYGLGQQGPPPGLLLIIAEAVAWARRALLLINDLTQTASSGWMVLSRAGQEFTRATVNQLRLRELLPEFMLHPAIRTVCLDIFNTGHYEAAVFEAFKTVEIAIREAAEFPEHEHGRPMVAKAFKVDGGPLTDSAEHFQEREALQMFASGAVGYFKNPRSHRRTDLNDRQEAAEMLIIASHLLRIVEARGRTSP